ncbi:MAG: hypothetical protein ACOWWO_13110 [Peptococcaceae bacterium]
MQTWDKIYLAVHDLLQRKNTTAGNLWSLAHYPEYAALKNKLLSLWRTEIHHTVNLNKLLQSLGYTQLHIMNRTINRNLDAAVIIPGAIADKEKWLPVLEKISQESFGNEIYAVLMLIIADEWINIELLKELAQEIRHTKDDSLED